jgi:hypothetical protein
MKTLDDLRAFYDSDLKAQMDALEKTRRHAVNLCLIAGVVLLAAGLFFGILTMTAGEPGCFIIVLIGVCVLAAGGFKLFTTSYRQDFKHIVIRRIIEFLEPNLRYFPEQGITKELFRTADFFPQHIDRYRCEDLVKGRIGQTDVAFSEIHAEYKVSTGKSTHWVTIFKGLFFIGDFHKHFRNRLLVLPDKAEKLFGALGQKMQAWNPSRSALIKLEDPEFEREFVVYGDDQIEARYILSPSLMERITAFRRKMGGEVHLAFVGSQVFVAVSKKEDWFEPLLWGSADFSTLLTYAAQLRLAADIVEDLNLNTRIWTKE